jgi:hypothetical protein
MDETRQLPHVRVLPGEEYERLRVFPPFAGGLPNPDFTRIIVAELGGPGGELVAVWSLIQAIHAEPMWVREDHRKRAGLIRRLWTSVWSELQAVGALMAFAIVADQDAAANVPLVLRLGFEKLPADLYMIRLTPGTGQAPVGPPD